MSALFISHSSKDKALALELQTHLQEAGHRSIFLDFDPENGISTGSDWQKKLFTKLRGCQAIVVLCSKDSKASQWCLAEIAQAKILGKMIFPIQADDCSLPDLLKDVQAIKLFENRSDGFRKLCQDIKGAGLDPRSLFDWDGSRSPYPGLFAFEERDAPVYFGRNKDIQDVKDALNRLRSLGEERLLLVLGASGSGKSSLVRAGVIPRLKRYERNAWLVLDPFRPAGVPLTKLATTLVEAIGRFGQVADVSALSEKLNAPDQNEDSKVTLLLNLAEDLRKAAGQREATVLLVIDQFEEMLGKEDEPIAHPFLRLLKSLLEHTNSPFLALATLRSDYLAAFQSYQIQEPIPYDGKFLNPLALSEFGQVIEGPAAVAGIELKPGLVHAMIADTKTNDALPLLAFTLRELWERFHDDGSLSIEEYRDHLGGLQGSVARTAEGLVPDNSLSEIRERHLRKAFLSLVRVNEEGGYVRKSVPWKEIPDDIEDIIERFVKARLLVSRNEGSERILEVAHEALFRSWKRLECWLSEGNEFLLWRDRLKENRLDWEKAALDENILLRGPLLDEAERWMNKRSDDLNLDDRRFIQSSIDVREKDRLTKARQRRQRIFSLVIVSIFVLILSAIGFIQTNAVKRQEVLVESQRILAMKQGQLAKERGMLAVSQRLAAQARALMSDRFEDAIVAALASYRVAATPEARAALLDVMVSQPRVQKIFRDSLSSAAFTTALSPDGKILITAGCAKYRFNQVDCAEGSIQRWDIRSGQRIGDRFLAHGNQIDAIAFFDNGQKFATSSAYDGSLITWDAETLQASPQIRLTDAPTPVVLDDAISGNLSEIFKTTFSNDGAFLAVGKHDGTLVVWDVRKGTPIDPPIRCFKVKKDLDNVAIASLGFSKNGRWLVAGSTGGEVCLLEIQDRIHVGLNRTFKAHESWVNDVALNTDGSWLATTSSDKKTKLWRLNDCWRRLKIDHPYRLNYDQGPVPEFNKPAVDKCTALTC